MACKGGIDVTIKPCKLYFNNIFEAKLCDEDLH